MQKISYSLESLKCHQLLTPDNYFEERSFITGRGWRGFVTLTPYSCVHNNEQIEVISSHLRALTKVHSNCSLIYWIYASN